MNRTASPAHHWSTPALLKTSEQAEELGELPLLSADERQQLLVEWNATQTGYPRNKFIHQLFEEQVERTPDAVAVMAGDQRLETRDWRSAARDQSPVSNLQSLTYRELNARTNQLARYLQALGVGGALGAETLVGLCVERSVAMVVGLLGILKAGGAYVPLDPSFPSERLAFMLQDANIRLLLTEASLQQSLGAGPDSVLVCLDRDWPIIAQWEPTNPAAGVQPHALAYVIYTSGSTGKPKGVQIEHGAVVNFLTAMQRKPGLTAQDVLLAVTTLSFDIAALELLLPLITGARLVLVDRETSSDGHRLAAALADTGATVMQATPATWRMLLDSGWQRPAHLKILCGGEALPRQLATALRPEVGELWNLYGPTETTIWSAIHRVQPGEGPVPIGRPIDNTLFYVLDQQGQPTPIGVPGELHIGGVGLARGYLNRPELTAEKFIPNPFSQRAAGDTGARLYKTSDRVRYRADGVLEFLGRLDHQVKIRGFRIELGEIEAMLMQHPAVKEAVVMVREDQPGDQRLVAYVTPHREAQADGPSSAMAHQNSQIAQWRQTYQETYSQPAPGLNLRFNPLGWNSSYTGLPLPEEELREQVGHTVARVRALLPARVLEIGCGTGLLLFELAPHCRRYVGADFSPAALAHAGGQLAAAGLSHVTLLERRADDFDGLAPGSFDVVVINSTVQYFPSADYLVRVLEGAMRMVTPGGYLFVGDVRSLPLLEAFHTSVELHRSGDTGLTRDLGERVRRRLHQERELVIAPEFFVALARRLPAIRCVDVRLKRGRHHNELTRFRYDVILQVGGEHIPAPARTVLEWANVASLPALRERLQTSKADCLAVTGIPNARVRAASQAATLIKQPDGPATVGQLRKRLAEIDPGIDPEAVWALAREFPYQVHLVWPTAGPHDYFDALFQRKPGSRLVPWLGNVGRASSWSTYTTTPLQRKLAGRLTPILRAYLRQHLPDYMLPAALVELAAMPLTPNGKIDRRALPRPGRQMQVDTSFVTAQTPLEQQLVAIWQEVLQVDQVGLDETFLELGGHSLLLVKLLSRLRAISDRPLTLVDLFRHQTIRALCEYLESPSAPQREQNRSSDQPAHRAEDAAPRESAR